MKSNKVVLVISAIGTMIHLFLGCLQLYRHYTRNPFYDSPHFNLLWWGQIHLMICGFLLAFLIVKYFYQGVFSNLLGTVLLVLTFIYSDGVFKPAYRWDWYWNEGMLSKLELFDLFREILLILGVSIIYLLLIYQLIFTIIQIIKLISGRNKPSSTN